MRSSASATAGRRRSSSPSSAGVTSFGASPMSRSSSPSSSSCLVDVVGGRRRRPPLRDRPGPGLEEAGVEVPPQELFRDAAPGVVGAGPATGPVDDLGRCGRRDGEHDGAEWHFHRAAQWPLARHHGPGQESGHAGVALQGGRRPIVDPCRDRRSVEPADGRHLDAGLAERGQDVLDVAEEQRVGTDDQHPLAFQRKAVGVEQVGGAVQGDRRLAGAWSALHDEHAAQRAADDLVLLPLDGRHDVAHAPGAGPLEGGEEGPRPRQAGAEAPAAESLVAGVAVATEGAVAEQLVFEVEHPAPLGQEVAAPREAHGLGPGRPVERLGDRSPPIHHERLLVIVGHGQASDVERLGRRLRGPRPCRRPRLGSTRPAVGSARSMRPKTSDSRPSCSCSRRFRLVRTRISRSVMAWNVPPRSPNAARSIARAFARIASSCS